MRLAQGDFARETLYSDDPGAALAGFAAEGAREAHIVDLDGARAGGPRQHRLLAALARGSDLRLQVAGGFRTSDQVAAVLDAGVERVVIGSLAVTDPDGFADMLDRFGPARLTRALDVRVEDGEALVAPHGWEVGSGRLLTDVLEAFPSVRHLLVTDIARDGMLGGPNLALAATIVGQYPTIKFQASGGVAALTDLADLRRVRAARAVVGKAIWEQRFTVAEGVRHARG